MLLLLLACATDGDDSATESRTVSTYERVEVQCTGDAGPISMHVPATEPALWQVAQVSYLEDGATYYDITAEQGQIAPGSTLELDCPANRPELAFRIVWLPL